MSIQGEFDKAIEKVIGFNPQVVRVLMVTGEPVQVAKAAFEARLVTVINFVGADWKAVAESINTIATLAGREKPDVLAMDVRNAWHEIHDGGCAYVLGKRTDPEILEAIREGSGMAAAYALFKGRLYNSQEAVLEKDYVAMVTEMNDIAEGLGRRGERINVGDVSAAQCHLIMNTVPPVKQRIVHVWQTETEKRYDWKCPYIPEVAALRQEIIRDFSHLWELNDEGHRVEHFDAVYRCGMYINEMTGNAFDARLILMAAFFHDLFAWSRYNHHKLSAKWVRTTDFPIMRHFTMDEIALIAIGCEEHRASRKEPFTHAFGELISSADRGFPATAEELLKRALRSRSKTDEDDVTKRERAVAHLKEKFGDTGYAKMPAIYRQLFAEQLAEQVKDVMAL